MVQHLMVNTMLLAQAAGEGSSVEANKRIGAALAIAIGGLGPGIGIGLAVSSAAAAIGRNPDAAGEVRTTMIIGAAFAEAIAIYALVIALVLAFT